MINKYTLLVSIYKFLIMASTLTHQETEDVLLSPQKAKKQSQDSKMEK